MSRLLTIVTIVLTIIGIITPIAWSIIEKNTSLSINLLTATPIAGINEGELNNDLVVTFRGEKIVNLVKYEFSLINSGSQPIDASSVKVFPNISFPSKNKLLHVTISHTLPPSVPSTISVSQPSQKITIQFDLLNQGDLINIIVYSDGELTTDYDTSARIVGLKELEYNNFSGPSTNQKLVSGYERFQELVTPIFSVALTGLIVLVLIRFSIPRSKCRKALLKNPELLISLNTQDGLVSFIQDNLFYYPRSVRNELIQSVNNSKIEEDIVLGALHEKLASYIFKFSAQEIPAMVGGAIGAGGVTVIAFMKLMA